MKNDWARSNTDPVLLGMDYPQVIALQGTRFKNKNLLVNVVRTKAFSHRSTQPGFLQLMVNEICSLVAGIYYKKSYLYFFSPIKKLTSPFLLEYDKWG